MQAGAFKSHRIPKDSLEQGSTPGFLTPWMVEIVDLDTPCPVLLINSLPIPHWNHPHSPRSCVQSVSFSRVSMIDPVPSFVLLVLLSLLSWGFSGNISLGPSLFCLETLWFCSFELPHPIKSTLGSFLAASGYLHLWCCHGWGEMREQFPNLGWKRGMPVVRIGCDVSVGPRMNPRGQNLQWESSSWRPRMELG